ncbi:IS1249 family transposase [Leucobacter sp. GX0328]
MLCGTKLVKNGKHPSGTQRWRCRNCGASSTRKRLDLTQREQLREFVTWLTGKHSQTEIDGTRTGRSFRRRTAWCWDLQPALPPCDTVFHAVMVDGIWIGTWCLLIAFSDTGHVLAWQWSGGETSAAWTALLEQIPAPGILVSDGGSGLPSALRQVWPHTKHQRCIFHLQLNITRHLTRNPRTTAGRALRRLVTQLSDVQDEDDAIVWQQRLDEWWRTFGYLTRERTLLRNGEFGYTHDRLRKAWLLVQNVVRKDLLFTYVVYGNPRTTSPLEGGVNALLRDVLKRHRGMNEEHRRRAAEWFLTLQELPLGEALTTAAPVPKKPSPRAPETPHKPALYDTGLQAADGLWKRAGWAGRG